MPSTLMSGAQVVLECLQREKVEVIFGYPGGVTLPLYDAIYDGPLLDEIPGSDIPVYCKTMARLAQLPARVVHAGHDPSFDGRRLKELAWEYLKRRA